MVWQVKTEQGSLRDCFSVESACYQRALHGYHRPDLGLSHDLHPLTMHGNGRPSPAPYFGSPFSSQGFGGSGGSAGGSHLTQYGDAGGQYGQYPPLVNYDTASPSLPQPPQSQPQQLQQQQQQQQQQHHDVGDEGGGSVGGGEMPPNPHGQWPYPGVPQHHYPPAPHPQHPRMALEDWGQHYLSLQPPPLHPAGGEGGTPPLHPHQQAYNPYGYGRLSLDGYEPQTHGLETSPSSGESSDPSQGGGQGGGSSTKQLRPPFEWMKPANVQPAPGKTRTKDKYRVVYSDHQRLELEKEFHFARYITIRRKAEIAQQLNLSERQVKIWFQNRRAKERKQNKKRDEASRRGQTTPGCVPKLEPLDSSPPINAPLHQHCPTSSPSMAMGVAQHPVLGQSAALNSGIGLPMMNGPTRFPNGGLQNRLSPALSQSMAGMTHEAHVGLPQTAAPGSLTQAPSHPSAGHLHLNHSLQLHPIQNGPAGKPGYDEEDV